jgi:hypothetical protein
MSSATGRTKLGTSEAETRPVYFSTDWDASTSELATCLRYLEGCIDVLGWQRVGVYGGKRTIDYMEKHGIRWLWQTYAWSGGKWSPYAHLQQYKNNVNLAGGYVDHNRSMQPDFGQWSLTGNASYAARHCDC